MVSDVLNIGDRAEITLKRDNKSSKKSFFTQVVDFDNDNPKRFVITSPISYGKIVLLPNKEIYTLVFYTKTSVISCDCKVEEHFRNGQFHNTIMEIISNFEKTQRRQFFRYPCLIPFKYVKLEIDADDHTNEQLVTLKEGIAKDLGGGGLRFVSKEGLEIGNYIQVVLPVDDDMIIAVGKVIIKTPLANDSALYKVEYRLKFSAIERKDQDRIVRYILGEQRKYLQKAGFIQKQH